MKSTIYLLQELWTERSEHTFIHVASLAFTPSSHEDGGNTKILTCHISSKLADIIHCAKASQRTQLQKKLVANEQYGHSLSI